MFYSCFCCFATVTDRLGLPRTRIIGVTMPGKGTTGRTKNNAVILMERLGITHREIPIESVGNPLMCYPHPLFGLLCVVLQAVRAHLISLGHEPCWQCLMCENAQARAVRCIQWNCLVQIVWQRVGSSLSHSLGRLLFSSSTRHPYPPAHPDPDGPRLPNRHRRSLRDCPRLVHVQRSVGTLFL